MSLHKAAVHLAAKGRGPDTMLVHMAPSEVAGLQALAKTAGGSLTLNPDTGLPEAGFLSNLLPTIIGAGVTAFTGGAVSPLMAGMGVGGLQALRTGSLSKGLSAGLGAYGGAGLTGNLMNMGTGALSQQAGAAAAQGLEGMAADQAAEQAIKEKLANASTWDKLRAGAGTFEWNKPMDFVRGLGGGDTKRGALMAGAAFLPTVMDVLAPQQSSRLGGDGAMPQRLRYDTATGRYVPISQQTAVRERGFAAGGMPEWNPKWTPDTPGYGNQGRNFGREILYYDAANAAPEEEEVAKKPVDERSMYDTTPDRGDGYETTGGNALSLGQTLSDFGLTSLGDTISANARMGMNAQTGAYSQEAQNQRAAEAAAMSYAPPELGTWGLGYDTGGMDVGGGGGYGGYNGESGGAQGFSGEYAAGGMAGYAAGGLGSLGSYSDGGRLLRGPGDGVSDSIPATIGRKRQPARLADGEFVVPARIVSELGNGSTEAGARKLYAMMDRIQANRKKSVGRGRVAVNAKSDRHLPA